MVIFVAISTAIFVELVTICWWLLRWAVDSLGIYFVAISDVSLWEQMPT